MKGHMFLDLIVFNAEKLKMQSLNDLCIAAKEKFGIDITKQSLHERFNEYALDFLKDALEKTLEKQIAKGIAFTECKAFNRILIKDSVCFQVDESLVGYYPGSGGSGSGAAVRIQFEYDILNGRINDLSINAFNDQDATDSVQTIELTQQGDLIIRDLAYMNLTVLQLIIVEKAFFLCRPNTVTKIYRNKTGEDVVDFNYEAEFMKKNNIKVMEKTVYLGSKERLELRLIQHLMPEEEVGKRIRKARENSKKKGRALPSKEYIARARLNLFITNANEDQIPTDSVWKLYRLRWQIELMFKIWKSLCDIEKVKKVNRYRLESYIYTKLIFIVLCWKIIWRTALNLYKLEGKALSFYKAYKTIINLYINELRGIFTTIKGALETFMRKFYEISRTNHLLEKRKQEPTSLELLIGCSNA